jgi:hypothetical protein
MNKNHCLKSFLQEFTPTESIDYSLWEANKELKYILKGSDDGV